ncbi:beta(1,3)galactosyltransferase EpsH [Enterococcus faecalis]|nr:beta(1,3)galactosyltransferase EpsH [Enterococcus faecalis]
MIFVILGSQKFSFNRLLQEVDQLIDRQVIKEEVVAQIGYSTFHSKHYIEKDFMGIEDFQQHIDRCRIVITHGGSGAIINALKKNKRVLAVPRLSEFNEHVDNHQLEITKEFKAQNYIELVTDICDLGTKLQMIETKCFSPFVSQSDQLIEDITSFIEQ